MRRLGVAVVSGCLAIGLGPVAATAMAAGGSERAIELVTPAGSDGRVQVGHTASTPDGEAVCYRTEGSLVGAPSNGEITAGDGFCSWRTPEGWETKWVTGPEQSEPQGHRGGTVYHISPDGKNVVFVSDAGIYPDYSGTTSTPPTLSSFLWRADLAMPRWLAPIPAPSAYIDARGIVPGSDEPDLFSPAYYPAGSYVKRDPLAVSEDLRYGIFRSAFPLVPEDTNTRDDLYQWTPDGIELVTRDASGQAVGGYAPSDYSVEQTTAQPGAMSRDGSRVFFERYGTLLPGDPADAFNVYRREGNTVLNVSPRRAGITHKKVKMAGASDDGNIVYLLAEEPLTTEPILTDPALIDPARGGYALYRYDVAAESMALMATAPTGIFILGTSEDGSTVVYRDGAREMFVRRADTTTSLGVLGPLDLTDPFAYVGSSRSDNRAIRVSRNGALVAFQSTGGLAGTPAGKSQVYAWTPERGLFRVSADASDSAPKGDAVLGNPGTMVPTTPRGTEFITNARGNANLGRSLTDDDRIFFETPDALVPQDINGAIDVYEWDRGTVRLVSPGTQRENAFYHDSSVDGSTVFFITSSALIPELDTNVRADLYAARVGGGFPLPTQAPKCVGEGCQGLLTIPPVLPVTGSAAFVGPDPVDPQDAKVSRGLSVAKVKPVRGTKGRLKVRVPEKGKVRISGSGLLRSSVSVKKAGTRRVSVRLSARSKRRQRQTGSVRVRVTVRFTPVRGRAQVKRVRVTFKRAGKAKRASRRTTSKSRSGAARKDGR